MGRVEQGGGRPPSAGPGAQRHHKQLTDSTKPTYKVILEEVTQTRKALKLEDYHSIVPPIDYKFVPAGDPTLTTKCKELARLDGKLVYAVTVHRVGFHFPSEIVTRALTSLGIDLDQEDDVLRKHEIWPKDEQKRVKRHKNMKNSNLSKKNGKLPLPKGLNLSNMTQAEVDAQAKAAILDMFPAIPEENLYQIILHSFELGTDKVGVQLNDLSLPRRVQLAVVAHIRHVYTDYDRLLSSLSWQGARAKVAPKTLEVLASWRGDKDDDIDVVEDILREVIVISDDEDEPQEMTSYPVNTTQPTSVARPTQLLQPVMPYESYAGLLDSGRSDRVGTRRQIWLDARERRKEPVLLPQAREHHSYYIPRPGRDAPVDIDQKLYERRLRGLESQTQPWMKNSQLAYPATSHAASYAGHDQAQFRVPIKMDRQNSKPEYVRQLKDNHRPSHSPQSSINEARARFDHNIHTPPKGKTASSQGKLELLPITDDILPSIETPRTERPLTSAFTRGAIHIDSPPPQDIRTEYNHLRRAPDNPSPIKRKREPSPTIESGSNRKDVVYLPIRESYPHYNPRDRGYEHRSLTEQQGSQSTTNQVIYLPLDENNRVKSYHRQDRDHMANKGMMQQSTAQIYLNDPRRNTDSPRSPVEGLKYQYIPLGPIQQSGNEFANSGNTIHSGTRLIPLNNYSEPISTRRPIDDEYTSKSLILLDSPTTLGRRQQYDEMGPNDRTVVPLQPSTEFPKQQYFLDRHQPFHGAPLRNNSQISKYEPIPYNPHESAAGLPYGPPHPRGSYEHKRYDSGLR